MGSYRSIPLCIGGGTDLLVSQLASMTLITLAMARAALTVQRHYGYPRTLWDLKCTVHYGFPKARRESKGTMEHVLRAAANSRMRSEMATDRPWDSQQRQPDGLHYDGEEEGTKEGSAATKATAASRCTMMLATRCGFTNATKASCIDLHWLTMCQWAGSEDRVHVSPSSPYQSIYDILSLAILKLSQALL